MLLKILKYRFFFFILQCFNLLWCFLNLLLNVTFVRYMDIRGVSVDFFRSLGRYFGIWGICGLLVVGFFFVVVVGIMGCVLVRDRELELGSFFFQRFGVLIFSRQVIYKCCDVCVRMYKVFGFGVGIRIVCIKLFVKYIVVLLVWDGDSYYRVRFQILRVMFI